MAEGTATKRILAIDGLRAVAVLAIIAFHFELGLPGGFLSLDLFFVMSGFVITRLLMTERAASGRIRLGRFWFLRVRRLMPAVFVTLLAVQVWMLVQNPPGLRTTTNGQTLAALGYVANWYAIVAHIDYWAVSGVEAPLSHLWSLAVEEQFYLLWPALVAAALAVAAVRTRPVLAAVAVSAGAAASYALAAWMYVPGSPDRVYLGTDTRAGALLLGAAVALSPQWPARLRHVIGPAIAVMAAGWFVAKMDTPALYQWQFPLMGIAAAALIGALARGDGTRWERLLSLPPALWVGRISYPLYLWHWPVWIFLRTTYPGWAPAPRVIVAVTASVALAALTHYLVERPVRISVKRPRALLPLAATGCLALALLAMIPVPPVQDARNGPIVSGPGNVGARP